MRQQQITKEKKDKQSIGIIADRSSGKTRLTQSIFIAQKNNYLLTKEQKQIIEEYALLASCSELSEEQAERMGAILEMAQFDDVLAFFTNEIDNWISEELNLLDEETINHYQSQITKISDVDRVELMETNHNLDSENFVSGDFLLNSELVIQDKIRMPDMMCDINWIGEQLNLDSENFVSGDFLLNSELVTQKERRIYNLLRFRMSLVDWQRNGEFAIFWKHCLKFLQYTFWEDGINNPYKRWLSSASAPPNNPGSTIGSPLFQTKNTSNSIKITVLGQRCAGKTACLSSLFDFGKFSLGHKENNVTNHYLTKHSLIVIGAPGLGSSFNDYSNNSLSRCVSVNTKEIEQEFHQWHSRQDIICYVIAPHRGLYHGEQKYLSELLAIQKSVTNQNKVIFVLNIHQHKYGGITATEKCVQEVKQKLIEIYQEIYSDHPPIFEVDCLSGEGINQVVEYMEKFISKQESTDITSSQHICINPLEKLTHLDQLSTKQKKMITEYFELATCAELSDQQAERMGEILEMAQFDDLVSSFINEIDNWICEQLDLLDEDSIHHYDNQIARLKEFLVFNSGQQAEIASDINFPLKNYHLILREVSVIC